MNQNVIQHEAHINKVWFLGAVVRLRWDSSFSFLFVGIFGFCLLIERIQSQKSNINRLAGSLETKTVSAPKGRLRRG